MKRISMLAVLLFMALTAGFGSRTTAKAGSLSVRGVWVSCFEYADLGLNDKSEAEFRTNANLLFSRIRANGCNTVYFHVRSYDDAIYPSSVTGWSKRISKKGKALPYDPLKILVDSAHRYGLSFHAWMNPYRVTQKKILDPALPETNDRIVAQVREIINKYKVDGIHFDDYFYPTNQKKYKKVKKAARMKNVNAMVRRVYSTVKKKSKRLKFGISPAGSMDYCESIGADIKTWMSRTGYVDYIVPQIYWSDQYIMSGKKTALFKKRLAEWRSYNKRDVPMYIGLALYKAGYSLKEDPGWKKKSGNIADQLSQIRAGNTEGYVLFSYTDLYRSGAAKEVKNYLTTVGKMKLSRQKKTLRAGKTYKLRATFTLERLRGRTIKWKSSNKKIATVTKNGRIKAKKKGRVTIYASYGKLKKKCTVKVLAKKKKAKKSKKKTKKK